MPLVSRTALYRAASMIPCTAAASFNARSVLTRPPLPRATPAAQDRRVPDIVRDSGTYLTYSGAN